MALAVLLKTGPFVLASDRAVLRRDEVDAIENATDLLHAAVAEADRLRSEAEQAVRERAEAIRSEGEALVRDEVARAVLGVQVNAAQMLRKLEPVLVEIVVDTVGHLAAGLDRRRLYDQALAEVGQAIGAQTFALLKVAPADFAHASDRVAELVREARLPATLTVRADPAVAEGDCVLLSDSGKLSIGLARQLGALAHTLRDAVGALAASPELAGRDG